jgi:hypothetical protein
MGSICVDSGVVNIITLAGRVGRSVDGDSGCVDRSGGLGSHLGERVGDASVTKCSSSCNRGGRVGSGSATRNA